MKILLDNYFSDTYEVFTVKDMKWNGIKNGELLLLLQKNNFDVWIVVDKNIPYQQNVSNLPCLVVVLDVYRNTLKHLIALIPKILKALNTTVEEKLVIIS